MNIDDHTSATDDNLVAAFTVTGEPVGKERPRFSNKRGKIRTYTPTKTKNAEAVIAWKFRASNREWIVDGDSAFAVIATFYSDTLQRKDVDNLLKLVCDALNEVAWADDAQVYEMLGKKGFDTLGTARTEVKIYRIGDLRSPTLVCQHCLQRFDTTSKTRKYCSRECSNASRRKATT